MNIVSLSTCPAIAYKAKAVPNSIQAQEKGLVEAAKKELEVIQAQGRQAGTDAAWWRPGYNEAVESLKSIVDGQPEKDTFTRSSSSSLMSFHDFGEDGLI